MKFDFTIDGYIGSERACADGVAAELTKRWGKTVNVEINSFGGDLFNGLRICGLFRQHGKVNAHISQWAASAATIAAMGARRVTADRTSLLLIHNVATPVMLMDYFNKEQLADIIKGLRSEQADLKTLDGVVAALYADRSGHPPAEMSRLMTAGRWLTAADAMAAGLIDEIVNSE